MMTTGSLILTKLGSDSFLITNLITYNIMKFFDNIHKKFFLYEALIS